MDGKTMTKLMRTHKVTIRELAARVGTTHKRVRQVRANGLHNFNAYSDWMLAITGKRPWGGQIVINGRLC
jgi:hypothetical protein